MQADTINRWLTLGANVGVVIRLFPVAFQINQEVRLARAQLFSDHTDSRREWNQAMMGGRPMEIVAKSIESPHELTLAELQAMDMYLVAALNELRRLEVLKEAGLHVGASVDGLQHFYFGNNFAKAWYREYGSQNEPQAVQDKIKHVSPEWLVSFFARLLENLDESAGQAIVHGN